METTQQYSVWLKPTLPTAIIPAEDMWLFDEALFTFPLFTPLFEIRHRIEHFKHDVVRAGNSKTPAIRILKKRTVTLGSWNEAMLDE